MGALLFFTKAVYEKLGGFCTGFGVYGLEHVDYTRRVWAAGLNNRIFAGPENCAEYIWNMDSATSEQQTLMSIYTEEESMPRADKLENVPKAYEYDAGIADNRPIYYPIKIEHEIIRMSSD